MYIHLGDKLIWWLKQQQKCMEWKECSSSVCQSFHLYEWKNFFLAKCFKWNAFLVFCFLFSTWKIHVSSFIFLWVLTTSAYFDKRNSFTIDVKHFCFNWNIKCYVSLRHSDKMTMENGDIFMGSVHISIF